MEGKLFSECRRKESGLSKDNIRREGDFRMDLDQIIDESRRCVQTLSKIELEDKYEEYSLDRLLMEIKEEALTLKDGDVVRNTSEQSVSIPLQQNIIQNHKIRMVDARLQRVAIYKKGREWLRTLYRKCIPERSVDAKQLLQYQNEIFVKVLYKTILLREVDEEAFTSACNNLRYDKNYRYELIETITHSKESDRIGIKVRNYKLKYYLYKTKKVVLSIPILGYLIRIPAELILLPKKMHRLQKSIIDLSHHYNQIEADKVCMEETIEEGQICLDTFHKMIENQKEMERIQEENRKLEEETTKKLLDLFYLKYNEDLMKDSRDEVMERAKVYLPQLESQFLDREKATLSIIDLGCGEGEFIQLLNYYGYPAYGVDSNSEVVSKVRKQHPEIKIIEENAFTYLTLLEDSTVDCISSIHMVEHLEFLELILLLKECLRVLKPNGLLIMETPNPQNILISSYYFNLDPTHKKPIPPELLQFYVRESGFEIKDTLFMRPLNFCPYDYEKEEEIKHIVFRFNMEQAYAIVAVKKE